MCKKLKLIIRSHESALKSNIYCTKLQIVHGQWWNRYQRINECSLT